MIPKIDIKNVLGGLPAITNADNVYAELADSQGKIGQSDLTSMILKKSNLDKIKIITKDSVPTDKIKIPLQNGIFIFIAEGVYGFCDIVSICTNKSPQVKIISSDGYGGLVITNTLLAGQRCIYPNNDQGVVEFRQNMGAVKIIAGAISL